MAASTNRWWAVGLAACATMMAGCYMPSIEGDTHRRRDFVCREVTLVLPFSLFPANTSPGDLGYVRGSFEENDSEPTNVEITRFADSENRTWGRDMAEFLGLSSATCPKPTDADDVRRVLVKGDNRLPWVYAMAPAGFSEGNGGSQPEYHAAGAWLYDG